MFTKLGIAVTVAALVCGSACAQSILLDKGEYGWFFQGGYIGAENSIVSGGEFDLGMAFGNLMDVGVRVSVSKTTYSFNWGYGPNKWETSETAIGPVLNAYPLRFGGKDAAFAVGLHEAAGFHTSEGGTNTNSIGATLNLIGYLSSRSGIVLSGGYFASSTSGGSGVSHSGMIGLNPFIKMAGSHPISLIGQYGFNEGPDSYAIGISVGMGRSRAKN